MNINSTKFKDLKLIKFKKFSDSRGDVIKVLNQKNKSLKFRCYESYISSSKKGTIRGLHGQIGKFSQAKVIYCIQGKALDIAIDLRKNSKTFGKIFKKIISSKNLLGVLIPKGFVHGVVILENNTTLINFCSSGYNPKKEFGVNIKSINLKLPKMKLYISNKDKNLVELNKLIDK
tara:strand:- start:408 stop:932 length:525 start_codon:yes stop_codon:yes gene_type:complete